MTLPRQMELWTLQIIKVHCNRQPLLAQLDSAIGTFLFGRSLFQPEFLICACRVGLPHQHQAEGTQVPRGMHPCTSPISKIGGKIRNVANSGWTSCSKSKFYTPSIEFWWLCEDLAFGYCASILNRILRSCIKWRCGLDHVWVLTSRRRLYVCTCTRHWNDLLQWQGLI